MILSLTLNCANDLLSLEGRLDWGAIEGALEPRHIETPLARLPVRLLAGLQLLMLLRDLSDDEVCAQWVENPYFQAFCGATAFSHELPLSSTELAAWRCDVGAESLQRHLIGAPAHGCAPALPETPKTFVVDIDGVVATLTPDNDYRLSGPITATIDAINLLFDRGHRIVMLTARGSATGIDWREVTRDQLSRWGLKYHELRFGKPAADYYVDDRMIAPAALVAMAGRRFSGPSASADRSPEAERSSGEQPFSVGRAPT